MPPFVYSGYRNPNVVAISDLLERPGQIEAQKAQAIAQAQAGATQQIGQAQAQAAQQSGQAWAGAAQGVGNAVGGAIQQATDPKRKIEMQQVADLKSLDNAYTQPGGRDAILKALPGHLRPQAAASFAAADENAAKVNEANLKAESASTEYVTGLAEGIKAHGYDPIAAQLAVSHAKQTFASNPSLVNQIQQLETQIHQNPTTAGVQALVDPILKTKEAQEKPVVLPATPRGGSPAQLVNPGSGATVATGTPSPAQAPTEAELAVKAAQGDPVAIAAMNRLKPAPPSRPLDQQLLEAISSGDTTKADAITKTMRTEAESKRDQAAVADITATRALTREAAQARLDDLTPSSAKNQQKFEQEYRTVLQRGMSSRSGGIGLEDAKVQQANHLQSIFEQNFDPQTGEWHIPRVQLNELALGLARLTAPGGQAGEAMLKEFQQRTAKGDLAGALTYLTGQPIAANTQAITQMLKDSIERQGRTAETNREGEMAYLRGLAPTDLDEDRRKKLEATSLNPLRQSRVIQNKATGERKLQVSLDGGISWK